MIGGADFSWPAVLVAGAALFLASCRPGLDSGPDLGPMSRVETVPIRLAQETRQALAGARDGRCSVDVALTAGSLVLAIGWRAEAAGTTVRMSFRSRDGSTRLLSQARLPPPLGGIEVWAETVVPVPEDLAGARGAIVFENDGAAAGSLFTALPELVPESADRPSIILISVDTLRADRLGCYGHPRPTSPAIDAMAREGTLLRNAFAQSSWTLPSHYSMMTSLYPSAHGVSPDRGQMAGVRGAHKTFRIRGSGREVTLAERLKAMGYFTAAITESGWVDARFGFDQGFISYFGHNDDRLVDGTQPLVLDWLRKHRNLPFFLFVHTYQTHQPYHQPAPYDTMFVDQDHVGYALPGVSLPIEVLEKFRDVTFPPMPGDVAAFRGMYDGEVRYVDSFIEALLATLREEGLEHKTIVLLTSDHGEELFDHGDFDHGDTLMDEVMRVPFILWGPGRIPPGEVHDAPVASLDVVPTLVELAGGEAAGTLQGRSLVPLLEGRHQDFTGRVLFAEGFAMVFQHLLDQDGSVPLASVWDGTDKLILHRTDPERVQLFDLSRDPAETVDLAAEQPRKVTRLRELIRVWDEESSQIRATIGESGGELDPAIMERLRALGYL